MCREALLAGDVVELLHVEGREELVELVPEGARVTQVDARVMARVSDAVTPPGVVAVVRTPPTDTPLPPEGDVLVLDGVADPGNVGTLVRTAAAFGARVVSLGGADPFGPKAVRASAGTCYRTPVHRPADRGADPAAGQGGLAVELRGGGRPLLGLAADGALDLAGAVAALQGVGVVLVVGSEPHGMGADVRGTLDAAVRIAMRPGVESLNVGAAGAIAMHALMGR